MKRAGYKPSQAAAIEAASSNGGQFLPPIMGATVFVMAAYTGIPYLEIAKAAVLPALIYFIMLLLYAELNARKLDLTTIPIEVNTKNLLLDAPLFIIPLGMLVVMLIIGYSLMTVIFWSIVTVVILGLISGLRKETKIDWHEVRDKMAEGAITGSNVAIILAVIGIAVAAIEVTGLTLKLSVLFGSLAGNNLFLLLIFTMITAILLGTAVPTPAAYVIVATVLSPLLIRLGLPTLQAHLFPMFFAFISHLTPPIGIGLLVACKLSDSKYKDGAIEVWKAAFPSLLLPFFFVYSPAILLQYDSVAVLIITILAITLAFFTLAIFFNRAWKNKLLPLEQIIILGSSLMSMFYILIDKSSVFVIVSLVLCIITLVWNSKRVTT
jgi:TRAP transporter 4TM/12TM fusion protein